MNFQRIGYLEAIHASIQRRRPFGGAAWEKGRANGTFW
jgi:hypothetical protein